MNRKRNRFCVLTFIASIVLFCPFYGPSAIADVNLVELEKIVKPAVVTIETYDKKGKPLGNGSGFFINKQGHLITNYHVLKGAYSTIVKTFDGKEYPVKLILAESETTDLIKVSVDIPEQMVKFIELSQNTPEVGERVIVVGSPLGLEQTVSEGIVSAIRDIPTIGKIFQISAPSFPGSSGGPVLNMKGQVIGIVTFGTWNAEQNMDFAVSGEQVLTLKLGKNKKSLTEWTSSVPEKEIDVWNLYLKGLMFIWVGEYEKSLDCFQKVIDANKFSAEAWFYAGYLYGKLGRHQEEIEAYKQTIRIRPVSLREHLILDRAYLHLGITCYELGRYQDAIEAYKRVIRINPDFADAHYNLGMTYSKLGHDSEAIESYKRAISVNPAYAEAYYNLGTTYGNLGRYQQEIKAYRQAIHFKPDYAKAYLNLGAAYDGLGQYKAAIEAAKQAIRIKPDDAMDYAMAYLNLGIGYGKLSRYQEAIEAFKQAIRIKPDFAKAYLNLGGTYGNLGRYREEIKVLKQAIRIKPNYVRAHFFLGYAYTLVEDKESAFEEYEILKTLDKDMANQLFNLIYE
ncbi:Photosystem I assembly protein Ycf3 [subsurface metagenome]